MLVQEVRKSGYGAAVTWRVPRGGAQPQERTAIFQRAYALSVWRNRLPLKEWDRQTIKGAITLKFPPVCIQILIRSTSSMQRVLCLLGGFYKLV